MQNETTTMSEIVEQDDARSETLQEHVFDTCATMRKLTEDSDYLSPAAAIEMVRLAVFMVNKVEEVEGLAEVIQRDDFEDMKAPVWGQVLMCMGSEQMTVEHKSFLCAVADHMGPDWLEWLRRDVAFMIRVEGFN